MAGVSSEGLKTAVLPSSRLGPEHPQRHGEGKVPGRDDGDDAPRLAADEGVLLGDLRGDDVAGRHPPGAEDVLDHVQTFDDLGPALGDHLAALTGHESGEVIGLALDDLGEIVEQLGTEDSAGPPPAGIGSASGGDSLASQRRGTGGEDADDLARASRATRFEASAVRREPVSGDQVPSGDAVGGESACHQRTPSRAERTGSRGERSRPKRLEKRSGIAVSYYTAGARKSARRCPRRAPHGSGEGNRSCHGCVSRVGRNCTCVNRSDPYNRDCICRRTRQRATLYRGLVEA